MPLLIDADARTTEVATAVNHLLALGGPRALSLRKVAATAHLNGSSLMHHYGSMDHLLRVCAFHTGRARVRQMSRRWPREGLLAHLPRTGDDVVDARSWLAWSELWRAEEGLEPTLREAREHERALIARRLDFEPGRDQLDSVVAMVEGLRIAVCAPEAPMHTTRARSLVAAAYPRWTGPQAQVAGDGPAAGAWLAWTG